MVRCLQQIDDQTVLLEWIEGATFPLSHPHLAYNIGEMIAALHMPAAADVPCSLVW